MKKMLIAIAVIGILVGFSATSFAGDWYMRLGGGYGLGLGGTHMGTQRTAENTWTKDVGVNVGQGFPISGEVGFKINENIAVEVGGGYTIGMESEIVNAIWLGGMGGDSQTYSWKGSWIPVTFAVKYAGKLGALKPYASLGTGIYYGTVIQRYTCKKWPGIYTNKLEREITMNGFSLGVNSTLGVEFPVSNLISIFCETRFDHVEFTPATGEVTKYIVDDVDQLSTLNINQKRGIGITAWPLSADCLSIRGGVIINL